MYLDFFDFLRHPFHASPDLELFFSSPSHKEALAAIARGTGRDPGFVAIFGEAGVGKTAVLHSYLAGSSLDDESTPVVIHNPELSFRELVKTIYEQRGWDFPAAARLPGLVTDFKSRLIEEFEGGRNVVVLIDEAHRMPAETLEKLGLFLDLVSSREKALQIVLFGRPELEEVLSGSEQIITRRATIVPLTRSESTQYMKYRLSKACGGGKLPLSRAAMRRIAAQCRGIPLEINILCENALMRVFAVQKKQVSRKIVNQSIDDLYGVSRIRKLLSSEFLPAMGLLLLITFWLFGLWRPNLSMVSKVISGSHFIRASLPLGHDGPPEEIAGPRREGKPGGAHSLAVHKAIPDMKGEVIAIIPKEPLAGKFGPDDQADAMKIAKPVVKPAGLDSQFVGPQLEMGPPARGRFTEK